ncbi:flagellar hook-associated protein FlgK [Bacilli bacterium]|uniref:flagellar hook-associated protein FlgK n=1 Tax=Oceanobacillus caeni TaxID=405946 RepID=UPI000621CF7E|nr:flagellar hook protein FlgK [Bacilli bacterium VT-13-104]PZD89611.1 flagellar hook-associated protein FlgK [Bacilli bacterium]PZD91133.1 flagellar hook-associated protein FlgK [Bacilli bacterium]PZD92680.1 flagellar hook-associated protein FlgK [Bacilli bacterium]RCO07479.1 flagellar hook-associated protein FlgK [Bacilli bacterium]
MSTFRGLEMAKQAIFTQQSALHTTGHNIANANTEGYTRQRVNFETNKPSPNASRNRQELPGQIGTGVKAGSIQRVRNQFLDVQFRGENSKFGYYETRNEALARMENMLNEPSDTGLSASMNQFWQSLQDLAVNPENAGARSVVLQRGKSLAGTFNYLSDSLNKIRGDLKNQLEVTLKDANTMLEEVNKINQEVRNLETHGYAANDLYDKRDVLLDKLSKIIPIEVTYDKQNNGDGVATVSIVDDTGNEIATLIDGKTDTVNTFSETGIYSEVNKLDVVSQIKVGDMTLSMDQLLSSKGSLSGLIESQGYTLDGQTVEGDYPVFLSKLDAMAFEFVEAFNNLHGDDFFSFDGNITDQNGAAGAIKVVLEDPTKINAGSESGNGQNALDLADLLHEPLTDLDDSSMMDFYESVIGDLGVIAEHAKRMTENTTILKSQVENQRMSVSAVSLDEELTNMLQFQHAYNAAARSMTATDELLDQVINRMGLVGR